MNDILNLLSNHYSPTLTFGLNLFERDIALVISVFESDEQWKEVKIAIDRYEAYDLISEINKEKH